MILEHEVYVSKSGFWWCFGIGPVYVSLNVYMPGFLVTIGAHAGSHHYAATLRGDQ